MSRDFASFLFLPSPYFEPISRYQIDKTYVDLLKGMLPEAWQILRDDVWLKVITKPGSGIPGIPKQGFKIHISGSPLTAREILELVVPELMQRNIHFKIVADARILQMLSSKNAGRSGSSKFLVAYPRNLEAFHELMTILAPKTAHLDGSYILSDRRLEGSRILFYRYGGFSTMAALNCDGSMTPLIEAPDGTLTPDIRLPYFKLPDWVDDPFGGSKDIRESAKTGKAALNDRYEVVGSLSFSNSGGVYTATDLVTGNKVVLKEARPLTNLWMDGDGDGRYLDSVAVLKNEYSVLSRLEHLSFVVNPIEFFQEWEHYYLAEEYFDGVPLSSFRASEAVTLLPFVRDPARVANFCHIFRTLATSLIRYLEEIHAAGVILGDLTPNNILVNPQTLELRLIDLESACLDTSTQDMKRYSKLWMTPGFRNGSAAELSKDLKPEEDFFSLARVLGSFLMPVTPLFVLEPAAESRILEKAYSSVALPREVAAVLTHLSQGAIDDAKKILESWDIAASVATEARQPEPRFEVSPDQLELHLAELSRFIANTATPERLDRLWPADLMLYSANPLCLAYGACGPAIFLRSRNELSPEAVEWMVRQPLSPVRVPPGFMNGLSGIAYGFDQLGLVDKADEVMALCYQSPLLRGESGYFDGTAGWGWASLYFHRRRQEKKYLDQAIEAGKHLIATAREGEAGSYWPRSDGKIHYGFAYGAAGIALFLFELYRATGDVAFLAKSREAIVFEMSSAVATQRGLTWSRWKSDRMTMPYWLYGGSGTGSALLRIYQHEPRQEDLDNLQKIASEAFSRFAAQVQQMEGMAGIGEFLVDMYRTTGDTTYRDQAFDIADSILRYRVTRPEGTAFPGRLCLRLSNDWGTGSAGVGLFFQRLLRPAPRLFHDLDANCTP